MRMLLLTSLLVFPTALLADDAVPHWKQVNDKSRVEWNVNYSGKPVTGSFSAFTSDIMFDPAHLDKSNVTVSIETAKLTTSDKDASENLPTSEWFASKKYPNAVFKSNSFRHIKDDRYEAAGTLTIRDKVVNLSLPFSLAIAGNHAVMNGQVTLNRLDYGVGQGDWTSTEAVAGNVKVTIHLEADKG